MNCMNKFNIPYGSENTDNVCPFCGYLENSPTEAVNQLRPWTKLNNRYTIGVVIGSGGFGITYKAWDNVLETVVAIKEYYPNGLVHRTDDVTVTSTTSRNENSFENGKERFLKEARSLARFNSDQ